jgi:hypothetical protein
VFNVLNCTSGVFGRTLLLIHVSSKHKLIRVGLCRRYIKKIYIYIYIYIPTMFLSPYTRIAAELWVNLFKDIIETYIKGIAPMIIRKENNLINIQF